MGWREAARAMLDARAAARLPDANAAKTAKTVGGTAGSGNFGDSVSWQTAGDSVALRLRRLADTPPEGISPFAWRGRFEAAVSFEKRWGDAARALGWSEADLYGMHPGAPLLRFDAMGRAFMTLDATVVEVTADHIAMAKGPQGQIQRAARPTFPALPAWDALNSPT